MTRFFETEFIGKSNISSNFCRCDTCKRLTMLSTYSTTRFAKMLNMPLFPLGKFRMVDECPQCGNRGVTSARKYEKERKRNLSLMMDGFASEADNPENCAHALHTLMIYNMESWFHDVRKSYGLRFETNMQIQYLIAQGLSRFGNYRDAMIYCRKAIVLGAGKQAEELLAYCQTLMDASDGTENLESLKVQPESTFRAYIPLMSLTASAALYVTVIGISSLRNYKAWIVNGTLHAYSFSLDDQTYELRPGATRQITLRLGEHELKSDFMPTRQFTYSIPLIKQLLNKNLLVINPDAMALLAYEDVSNQSNAKGTCFSYMDQVRMFPGISEPQHGLRRIDSQSSRKESISLYRPESHMGMVRLMKELNLKVAATSYARAALLMDPASDESTPLLNMALDGADDVEIQKFLQHGLNQKPTLLPWHLYYQNYMTIHHPEHNLEREYTLYCKNHSEDPQSYYLLACVVKDRSNAYRFFEYSDKQKGMGGLGLYAIARELCVRGNFREAQPYAQAAVEMAPENLQFSDLNEQILLALRDYDTLLEQTLHTRENPSERELAEKTVLYLTCAGYHKEAAKAIERAGEKQSTELPRLNAIRFYTVGNIPDYLECLAEMNRSRSAFEKSLHMNRIEEADDMLSKKEDHPYWEHLVLYCAAMSLNNQEIAERNINKAIAELDQSSIGYFKLARLLSGEDEVSVDAIRAVDIDSSEKAILCVALGYRFPENQRAFSELALTYNFTPVYPQLLVKKWINNTSATRPASARSSQTVALGM